MKVTPVVLPRMMCLSASTCVKIAGMDRQELLSFLVRAILSRKIDGQPLKVAIDGRCGAGKSVLAAEFGTLINSQGFQVLPLSIDGFHHPRERRYRQGEHSPQGYYEDAYDYEAVVDTLRKPSSGILIFDGIFLYRRELNPYWDFRVLLDVDRDTSLSRAIARDTGVIGPADLTRRKYEVRYEPAWQIYWNAERPEYKSDVIVDNRDVSRPRMLRPWEARVLE
jgi:uridine kinase